MIRRDGSGQGGNPVEQMRDALEGGDSLIMFPEGTRNTGDDILLPLKSGLFHLARACPNVRLVPVWIENLKRVLPKGTLVPIPLACTVRFGTPIKLAEGEDKNTFIAARAPPCSTCAPNTTATTRPRAPHHDRTVSLRLDHAQALRRRLRCAGAGLGHRRGAQVARGARPAAFGDRQPQLTRQRVVGDGGGDRPGLRASARAA
jgi:hypothetical protein